mgnify:CR=1 FL=1
MYLLPAIDILGGKAVRLQKGDYAKAVECADKALESGYDVPEAYLRDLAAYR